MVHASSEQTPFAKWLRAVANLDDADLANLLARRPDVVAQRPASLTEVATGLVAGRSAKMFYDLADRSSQQLLEALCAVGTPATISALASALGCTGGEVGELVEGLRLAGMVLVDGPRVEANPGLADAIPFPCSLGPPAASLFGRLSNSELAQMAARLGLPTSGAKPELVRRVTSGLTDVAAVQALLDKAPAGTARLVATAAHEWPQFQINGGTAAAEHQQHSPSGWCLRHGLLVATSWATAVMPREVALAFRGGMLFSSFQPGAPQVISRTVDADQVDSIAAEAALRLVTDVAKICEAWSAAPAKVLKDGGIGVKELRRAGKLVGREEAVTAQLVELAGAAGLIGVDHQGETASPTGGYDAWAGRASASRWCDLASAWLNASFEISLAGSRDDEGHPLPPLFGGAPEVNALVRRVLLLDLMTSAGPGSAFDQADIEAVARWRRPSAWSTNVGGTSQCVDRVLAGAEMTGLLAGGAASSFGCLLMHGDPEGAAKYLGSLVPPIVDRVVLQADFTATVAGEPAAGLRTELDLLADVESAGHATVWRMSEATLRRAFDAGRSSGQILGFLREHAVHGVPQPMSYLVEDIGRRHGRARTGTAASYVRSDDEALLAELAQAKKTARLGLRLLAPTVAVSARPHHEVTAALREAGYLPAVEGPGGEIVPQRLASNRADPLPWATGGTDGLAGGVEDFEDLSSEDQELLATMLQDPDLIAELMGVPADMAAMMAQLVPGAPGLPSSTEDLSALATRLRHAPIATPPADKKAAGPAKPAPQLPSLWDEGLARPSHIAKGPTAISELLAQALEGGWAVRMGYVNSKGLEREFFAEVLGIGPAAVRVRYLDQHGGGELALYKVQWARALTEAEEELLG